MTEDAVAVDMTAGVEYAGPDEIRAWIENEPEFTVLDVMACGDEAVAAPDRAAYGYAMSSSTQPGGTEGVSVVHLDQDGNVHRFLSYSTGVEGDPSTPNVLPETDTVVVDEYLRAYADRDEDAFVAVVSDDFVRYTGPTGLSAPAFPGSRRIPNVGRRNGGPERDRRHGRNGCRQRPLGCACGHLVRRRR